MHIFSAGNYGPDDDWPRERLQKVVDNFNRYQKPETHDGKLPRVPGVWISKETAQKLGEHSRLPVDPDLGRAPSGEIGVGHEEGQEYAKALLGRTDLPACGWPVNLWLDGDDLWADIEGMPLEVASLVNGGQLPRASAEFYNDYLDQNSGQSYGPVLRRISLLGGDIPRLKNLQRNPVFVHSEPAHGANGRFVSFFTERHMGRQELLFKLREVGCDTGVITDAVPDRVLQEMLDAFKSKMDAAPAKPETVVTATPATPLPAAPTVSNSEPTMDKAKTHAEPPVSGHMSPSHKGVILFSEDGEPAFIKKEEEGKVEPYDSENAEHCRSYAEHMKRKFSELDRKHSAHVQHFGEMPQFNSQPMQPDMGGGMAGGADRQQAPGPDMGGGMAANGELKGQIPPTKTPTAQPQLDAGPSEIGAFAERYLKPMQIQLAQQQAEIVRLKNNEAALTRQVQMVNSGALAEQNRLQRQRVTEFCERLVKEGRVLPKELDPREAPGGRTLVDLILDQPDGQKIAKFGERMLSARESFMESLQARPVIRKFSEQVQAELEQAGSLTDKDRSRLMGYTARGRQALKKLQGTPSKN